MTLPVHLACPADVLVPVTATLRRGRAASR